MTRPWSKLTREKRVWKMGNQIEKDDDEIPMVTRLAYRLFMSHPETSKWNLSARDFDKLDSHEIKTRMYDQARQVLKEISRPTRAMYAAGDAVHSGGPPLTARIYGAVIKEAVDGG